MSAAITLRWKVASLLHRRLTPAVAFNTSSNTGLFSRLGIALTWAYVPTLLLPTITYHQVIRNELKRRLGVTLTSSRFPYRAHVKALDADVSFAIRLKIFPPTVLLLDVEIDQIKAPPDLRTLIPWQRLDILRPISDVVRWTIGMIDSGSHREFDLSRPFRFKPAIHLHGVFGRDTFHDDVQRRMNELIGVLIRNLDYDGMDRQIPTAIMEKNAELNRKSAHDLLLVDKQGLLYVTSAHRTSSMGGRSTFMQVRDLQEIAMAFELFLRLYPSLRLQNEDFADFLLSRVIPWIRHADAVFARSLTGLHAWRLLLSELSLDSQLGLALTDIARIALVEKAQYFDRLGQHWWQDSEFGDILHHRISASRDLPLGFLANPDLTRLVTEDYAEAKRSLQARNYKSTVLLCGSIAEAMLTSALIASAQPGLTTEKLYREDLGSLIDESAKAKILTDQSLQSLLQPLRQYRNMIHPGVQIRKSLEPDSSKASIAIEIVKLLARHLGHTFQSRP